MNTCNENGECLQQVSCSCYNEETDEYFEECVCGYREHEGCYLPSDCCSPVECINYEHCHSKLPKYVLDVHNGMCMKCDIIMGPHRYTNEVEECFVCFERKRMLVLECNHKLCKDCNYHIRLNGSGQCPMCRNSSEWTSKYSWKNLLTFP